MTLPQFLQLALEAMGRHRPILKIPQSVGTVLVDGAVAATWAWRDDRVEVDELATLGVAQRREIATEADRLTAFYRG